MIAEATGPHSRGVEAGDLCRKVAGIRRHLLHTEESRHDAHLAGTGGRRGGVCPLPGHVRRVRAAPRPGRHGAQRPRAPGPVARGPDHDLRLPRGARGIPGRPVRGHLGLHVASEHAGVRGGRRHDRDGRGHTGPCADVAAAGGGRRRSGGGGGLRWGRLGYFQRETSAPARTGRRPARLGADPPGGSPVAGGSARDGDGHGAPALPDRAGLPGVGGCRRIGPHGHGHDGSPGRRHGVVAPHPRHDRTYVDVTLAPLGDGRRGGRHRLPGRGHDDARDGPLSSRARLPAVGNGGGGGALLHPGTAAVAPCKEATYFFR
jgi:hypothetical protein